MVTLGDVTEGRFHGNSIRRSDDEEQDARFLAVRVYQKNPISAPTFGLEIPEVGEPLACRLRPFVVLS